MKQKFYFLCGSYEKRNFIYAIKFAQHEWHYFEEADTLSSTHGSLPQVLDGLIGTLKDVKCILVPLDEDQSRNYYDDGKFIFNNKELKTHMQLGDLVPNDPKTLKSKFKKSDQLLFVSGQTNPLFFLSEFEKCRDLKTDKDKTFKLRNFVDEAHKVEFSELYFTGDWTSVREAFIRKYSKPFTHNKKKETNIDFYQEDSLRSYVDRKLKSLSSYTSMPLVNQMEVVLMELPNEISNLFLVNEKLTCSKLDILEFCDSIQDLAQTLRESTEEQPAVEIENEFQMDLEIFDYESEMQSEASESISSITSVRGRGRGRERGRGRGGGRSSSDYGTTEDELTNVKSVKKNEGKITKRGPGRPRKNLLPIPESRAIDYINDHLSDASSPN